MDPLSSFLESVNQSPLDAVVSQQPQGAELRRQLSVQTASSDIFGSSRGSSRDSFAIPNRPQSHGAAAKLNEISAHAPTDRLSPVATRRSQSARSDASYGIKAKLPPINAEFQAHQRLIPRTQGPSNYIKRHNLSHGLPLPGTLPKTQDGSQSTSPRNGGIRLASLTSPDGPLSQRSAGEDGAKSHWSCSSVGDLEVLDSILDQLVVLDTNMKEALMNGPLISFETVVPEPRATDMYSRAEDLKDNTFLTSVKETMSVAGADMGHEAAAARVEMATLPEDETTSSSPAGFVGHMDGSVEWDQGYPGAGAMAAIQEREEVEALRASMPVPILPKLARMYITNQKNQAGRAPPPVPPTADYLLRNRPGSNLAAPSYNALCQQIRDVQRQYTCGTTKETNHTGEVQNNNNMYISGLDGPSLEDVVMHEDLPIGLEHARPSFVAMKRTMASARKPPKWSTSTYR